MSKKLRLLLLDAGIVIELHSLGLWNQVVEKCEIILAETVIGEARVTNTGEKIDIVPDIQERRILKVSVELSEVNAFLRRFDPSYLDRLDPGETEALAYLLSRPEPCRICSADQIVYKVLGRLQCSDQGISLEEVLGCIGLNQELKWKFTAQFRIRYTRVGQQDMITDIGLKEKRN